MWWRFSFQPIRICHLPVFAVIVCANWWPSGTHTMKPPECRFCRGRGAVNQNFTSADILGVSFEFTLPVSMCFLLKVPLEYGVLGPVLPAIQWPKWQPWSHSWHKLKHVLSWCCQGWPALSPVVFIISMEWISRCGRGGMLGAGSLIKLVSYLFSVWMHVWKMEREMDRQSGAVTVMIHCSWPLGVGATLENRIHQPGYSSFCEGFRHSDWTHSQATAPLNHKEPTG